MRDLLKAIGRVIRYAGRRPKHFEFDGYLGDRVILTTKLEERYDCD